ncbi:MAG: MATE family efflux transporter, partial [Candidatus Methanomethylophilaceae archaeon]
MVILLQRIFIIAASGTVGVSLFNVPFKYVNLCMCPCEAIGMAMVPVTAAAYGQNDLMKMKEGMRYALGFALGISFVMVMIMTVMSEPMVMVFTGEESMHAYKAEFLWNLRMYALILPFFTIQVLCSSILQAIKRSMKPLQLTTVLGVVKLMMFWIASYYDYRAITMALILNYVYSALFMAILARRALRKLEHRVTDMSLTGV